jgi:uncharacterized protein (DUF362 family)/Pyruvate/2-oxoacid:ferredoxin oxidoreductase delta subunit
VEAACRLLLDRGAVPVISDSPGGLIRSPATVFETTGISGIIKKLGLKTVYLDSSTPEQHVLPDGTVLYISGFLKEIDGIINLPKLKSHCLTLTSLSVKNLYGLVPGFRKGEYHKHFTAPRKIAWIMAELYDRIRPMVSLNILDGIVGMEGNGPTGGTPREFSIMGLSQDAGALDSATESLLEFRRPSPILEELTRRGTVPDYEVNWPKGDPTVIENFRVPGNWHFSLIPAWLPRLLGRLVQVYPAVNVDKCVRCGLCQRSCPVKAIDMTPGRTTPEFDDKRCIRCQCCRELCPESAVGFKETFLSRIYS